jgi:multiple sugar transport system substrate-binding protein
MTLKRFIVFTVLLLSATVLFGGGNQQPSTRPSGPTEIIFYMWEDPTYIDIVNAFNESQSAIRVNAQILPSADYETRLTTLLAGGARMDAFMQKRQVDMFGHHAAGHIQPLDQLIQQFGYDFDAVSAYASALQINGQTLAIPFRGATYYTYYNKSLFDAMGVPYPSTFVERGEWTWDKFTEIAKQVTGPNHYGVQVHTWGTLQAIPAFQRQRHLITADGQIDIDDSVLQFFRIRKELEQAGAMYPMLELLTSRIHYSTIFFENQAAMLLIGEWFPGMLIAANREGNLRFGWDQWGITRLPSDAPSDQYRSMGAPTFNHVHARSQNKEAAFQFIAWMGSATGAAVVAEAGFLPPLINDEIRDILRSAVPDPRSFVTFTEGPDVFPPFYNKYGSRVDALMGRLMQEYLTQDFTDAAFTALLRRELQEIINTTN